MMSDAEEAMAAPTSLKKTPPSKGKLSKALKVAAAVQGALSRAGGKLLQGAELYAFHFSLCLVRATLLRRLGVMLSD